jgi:ABC-type sugar transport system substrate-binding protein
MIQKGSIKVRVMVGLAAILMVAAACSAAPGGSSGGAKTYTIGFTNPGGVGNGWREAMLCSA